MIYRAIVSAILRKATAFLNEARALVNSAEVEAKRIEAAAKAELQTLEKELVAKIAAL